MKIDEVSKWVWDSTNAMDKLVVDKLQRLAEAKGIPMAQLALAWLLSRPGVTAPIVGTTSVKHVEDAVAALAITLTPEDIAALEAPYQPHPVLGMM